MGQVEDEVVQARSIDGAVVCRLALNEYVHVSVGAVPEHDYDLAVDVPGVIGSHYGDERRIRVGDLDTETVKLLHHGVVKKLGRGRDPHPHRLVHTWSLAAVPVATPPPKR